MTNRNFHSLLEPICISAGQGTAEVTCIFWPGVRNTICMMLDIISMILVKALSIALKLYLNAGVSNVIVHVSMSINYVTEPIVYKVPYI